MSSLTEAILQKPFQLPAITTVLQGSTNVRVSRAKKNKKKPTGKQIKQIKSLSVVVQDARKEDCVQLSVAGKTWAGLHQQGA